MHDTKARDPVAGVLDEPQQREQALDVRGVEELQAAELHEGNVAPCQPDFERCAVMRRPEENRLLHQARTNLAVFQHAFDDVASLASHGRSDDWRSVQRFLVKRSVVTSITLLAAARMGWVER